MLKIYPLEKDALNAYWANPADPAANPTILGNFTLVMITNLFHAKKFALNSS